MKKSVSAGTMGVLDEETVLSSHFSPLLGPEWAERRFQAFLPVRPVARGQVVASMARGVFG